MPNTPAIDIGIYYGADAGHAGEFAQYAENLKFDTMWVGDGPTSRHPYHEPFVALSFAAAATKNLKLATGIALLPFFNPIRLAQTIASLDVLSHGRAMLGVGVGGEFEKQFNAFGFPLEERGKRTNEYLEILINLWSHETSSYKGNFYEYTDLTTPMKPLQKPHPPIWVGGRMGGVLIRPDGTKQFKSRTATIKRAAKYAQGWLPFNLDATQFRDGLSMLRNFATEFGRDASKIAVGAPDNPWIVVTDDTGIEVRRDIEERYGAQLKYAFTGTPKELIKQMEEFISIGARYFVYNPVTEGKESIPGFELIAKKVIPYFK